MIKYDEIHNPETGEFFRNDPAAQKAKRGFIATTVALSILGAPYVLFATPLALLCKAVAHFGNRGMRYTARSDAPAPLAVGAALSLHSNNVGGLPDISALNGLTN